MAGEVPGSGDKRDPGPAANRRLLPGGLDSHRCPTDRCAHAGPRRAVPGILAGSRGPGPAAGPSRSAKRPEGSI